MNPPKIAYVLKMFPRFSETFILNEILELERLGQRVEIFSLHQPIDPEVHADVEKLRSKVTYLPARITAEMIDRQVGRGDRSRIARTYLGREIKAARLAGDRKRRKRALQAAFVTPMLKRAGVGHVHAHFATSATDVALQIGRLTDLPFSFTAHAKDIFHESVDRPALRRKLRAARFSVTVSDFNRRHLLQLAPSADIHRIYNGLDLDLFRRRSPGRESDAKQSPLILAVGRLVEKKGFDVLLRACALLHDRGRDFRCQIVGKGDRRAELEALIGDLGIGARVDLLGPMPREQLLSLLPRASIFAAPCRIGGDGNRDGLPTVLIEAMATGLPVISTPVTGIPELVRDGRTGLLVPENDPYRLAAAIERLLDQPRLAETLARAGRRRVEQSFDLGRNVAELHARFEERAHALRLPVY